MPSLRTVQNYGSSRISGPEGPDPQNKKIPLQHVQRNFRAAQTLRRFQKVYDILNPEIPFQTAGLLTSLLPRKRLLGAFAPMACCFLVRVTAEVTVPDLHRFPNCRIICDRPTHNIKLKSNQNAKNSPADSAKEFPENDIPARQYSVLPANAPHPGNSACGRSSDLASSSETPSQSLRPNGLLFPRPPYSRGDCTGFTPVSQLCESTGFAAVHYTIIRIPPEACAILPSGSPQTVSKSLLLNKYTSGVPGCQFLFGKFFIFSAFFRKIPRNL